MVDRQYLPSWFHVWKFIEHCRYCGHRTMGDNVPAALQEHNQHVDRCMRARGLKPQRSQTFNSGSNQ